jgi:hypothetical protein
MMCANPCFSARTHHAEAGCLTYPFDTARYLAVPKKKLMPLRLRHLMLLVLFVAMRTGASAQNDTLPPVSINPQLLEIFNAKSPRTYQIAGITVSGNQAFDPNLIISISGLAVGDKVNIPGTDVFSKAMETKPDCRCAGEFHRPPGR